MLAEPARCGQGQLQRNFVAPTVRFQLKRVHFPAMQGAVHPPALAVERPLVLVVDDSVDVVRLLALILGGAFQVVFATGGAQGLELARRRLPQLILLDVEMPGLDGFAVAKVLSNDPSTRAIPILFVSADDPNSKLAESGAIGWIRKPFAAAEVLTAVGAQLHGSRL